MREEKQPFEYNYSSAEQAEIRRIREKYAVAPQGEVGKMERLRRLDQRVTAKATGVALALGITGSLIMGTGMSLIMTDLGEMLGLNGVMPIGIAVGLVGLVGVVLAYPMYLHIVKKERERIAPEIMRLTDELLK